MNCEPFKPETWPLDADGFEANLCTDCGKPVRYGSRHGHCLEAPSPCPPRAQQGHLYQHGGSRVIAMESGRSVRVRSLDDSAPLGIGPAYSVRAEWLTPLPMRYFRGEVPT